MALLPKHNDKQRTIHSSIRELFPGRFFTVRLSERTVCVCVAAVFVLLLIPLFWIAFYSVPCADDFTFSVGAHLVWKETGSLWEVIKAAAERTKDAYYSWQGTFSSIFLSILAPETFRPYRYFWAPIFILASFFISGFFFCWALFRRCFHGSRAQYLIITMIWLGISSQMLPSAIQGFYWNSGALLYTFFFSLSLVFFGLVILFMQEKQQPGRIIKMVILCILAFTLGGGNYITALQCVIFMAGGIFVSYMLKQPRGKWLVLPFLFLCIAFLINIIAPGNALRQTRMHPTSVPQAILRSFYYAVIHTDTWLNIPTIALLVFLLPTLWRIAKNSRFSFPFPVIVCGASFCVFASQFCPTIYAAGYPPHTRQLNIVFFSFILLVIFDLFYILGWAAQRVQFSGKDFGFRNGGYSLAGILLTLVVFVVSCPCVTSTPFTSLSAAKSLVTGEAAQYYQEYTERVELLLDETQKDVHLKAYTVKPYVLYFDDATSDPLDWRNNAIRAFYEKESVIVE